MNEDANYTLNVQSIQQGHVGVMFTILAEALYSWKSHESLNWVGPSLIVPLLSDTHQIKAVLVVFECVCHWFFWVLWNAVKVTHVKDNREPKQSHNKALEWCIIRVVFSKKVHLLFYYGVTFFGGVGGLFCNEWHLWIMKCHISACKV